MRRTRSKAADVYKTYLKKYKITEKTRYNELLIVVDNQLVSLAGMDCSSVIIYNSVKSKRGKSRR